MVEAVPAAAAIATQQADLIAFGRPFISNPDLPQRLQNGWLLAPADDMEHWYGGGAAGYTDYPAYR